MRLYGVTQESVTLLTDTRNRLVLFVRYKSYYVYIQFSPTLRKPQNATTVDKKKRSALGSANDIPRSTLFIFTTKRGRSLCEFNDKFAFVGLMLEGNKHTIYYLPHNNYFYIRFDDFIDIKIILIIFSIN